MHKSINTRYIEITPRIQNDGIAGVPDFGLARRASLVHKTRSLLLTMDLQF